MLLSWHARVIDTCFDSVLQLSASAECSICEEPCPKLLEVGLAVLSTASLIAAHDKWRATRPRWNYLLVGWWVGGLVDWWPVNDAQ